MKKWGLFAISAFLSACAQGGGSSSVPVEAVEPSVCQVSAPSTMQDSTPSFDSGTLQATSSSGAARTSGNRVQSDPYARLGKVVLASAQSSDSGSRPLSIASTEKRDESFSASTRFTVLLRESCQDGEISRSIRTSAKETVSPSGVRSHTWILDRELSREGLEELAERDSCVVGVSESTETKTQALPSDPLVGTQRHLTAIEVASAERRLLPESSSTPIVIAVVDTGADMAHEDLKDVFWTNPGEIADNGIDDDRNGYVDDVHGYNFAADIGDPGVDVEQSGFQHGTHVAGLVAARGGNGIGGSGIMRRRARLMTLNVFGNNPGATSADIVNAIRYAADNGAKVINLSIGGTGPNAAYESAVSYAIRKGAVVVAAAGNSSAELSTKHFMSPASYARQFNGMLSVGSVDVSNASLSTFSNFGESFVEIAAPGSENSYMSLGLLSTFPLDQYLRLQGTSMATPVVSGAAAMAFTLLRDRGYEPSPATIETLLAYTSRAVPSLQGKVSGARLINLRRLADFIDSAYVRAQAGQGGDPGVPGVPVVDNCR